MMPPDPSNPIVADPPRAWERNVQPFLESGREYSYAAPARSVEIETRRPSFDLNAISAQDPVMTTFADHEGEFGRAH